MEFAFLFGWKRHTNTDRHTDTHTHTHTEGRPSAACKTLRKPGVEPGSQAWEACMMPLHYMRMWHVIEVCVGTWLPKTCEDSAPILLGQMR